MVTISLDFVWSVSDLGELQVDVTPANDEDSAIGTFTFDNATILDAVEEDVAEFNRSRDESDIVEAIALYDNLSNLVERMGEKLRRAGAFDDD